MAEIIDVMTLLPDHSPYFTVDTTGPLSVDIEIPTDTPALDYYFRSAGGFRIFTKGDSFIILSMGFVLPESFGMACAPSNNTQNNPSIRVFAKPSTGDSIPLYGLGTEGMLLPIENYEMPVNIFVDVNKIVSGEIHPLSTYYFSLVGSFEGLATGIKPQVSMIGVPAALNGTVQHLTVFIKVLHTEALVD